MRDIEDIIKEKNGHENPFRVPEGYFNDLTSRIMVQLPADEPVVGLSLIHISEPTRPY